jgi:rootletin
MQSALSGLSSEKDLEIQQLQERISGLQQQIDNVCQQHEEVLLRAESDKQQALLIAHHDHQAVVDRLEELRREMEAEKASCERSKREAAMKAEQDRTVINQLRDNLSAVSSKLEQFR